MARKLILLFYPKQSKYLLQFKRYTPCYHVAGIALIEKCNSKTVIDQPTCSYPNF